MGPRRNNHLGKELTQREQELYVLTLSLPIPTELTVESMRLACESYRAISSARL